MFFFAAVAQLDRVLGYEPRGRGFDSCQPRHIQTDQLFLTGPFFISAASSCRRFVLLIDQPTRTS